MKTKTAFLSLLVIGAVFVLPYTANAASEYFTTSDYNGALDGNDVDSTTYTDVEDIGRTGSNTNILALKYRPSASHNVCSIQVDLQKQGSPTDTLKLDIYLGTTTTNGTNDPDAFGTFIATADQQWSISSTSALIYEYTFTPCVPIFPDWQKDYLFTFSRTGSQDNTNYYRIITARDDHVVQYGNGTADRVWKFKSSGNNDIAGVTVNSVFHYEYPYYILNGTENYSIVSPQDETQSNCTAPADILDVGGGITYSFCYLFMPAPSVINQFSSLGDSLDTKIPFSYITEIQGFMTGATTTENFQGLEIDYESLGYGSTSPMGNILTNIDFNQETVTTYLPDPVYDTFMLLQATSYYLAFAFYVYRRASKFQL